MPSLSATCALCSLAPAPALPAEGPAWVWPGCEEGESARPAGPFLAPPWLLTPCGAQVSSWCDPCTCSQICIPLPLWPRAFATNQLTSTLEAENKDVFLSFHSPSPVKFVFSSRPHPIPWESEGLAFSSSFVINSLYDFRQVPCLSELLFPSIQSLWKVVLDL